VSDDQHSLARSQREAEILATLNHPNIGAVYGLEQVDGMTGIVLELVEGETLADLIARGPLAIDDALPIARQIADALEAAHEKGVIHRDLKPANIKVREDGTVKALDFGLAKLLDTEPAPSSQMRGYSPRLTNSPTITTPAMTMAGVILGTAAYMSPEQSRGRPADKRSDVWAFGCVLYEMLTGRQAFDGGTLTDVLAAIVKNEPAWDALPRQTPPIIRALLERCLRKDPAQRLQHLGDARIEIEDAIASPSIETDEKRSPGATWVRAVPWMLTTLLSVVALLLAAQHRSISPASIVRVTRMELTLPEGVELRKVTAQNAALAPDGARAAFTVNVGGRPQVYVRRLDESAAVPLRGTEGAVSCFFSSDGRAVAFTTGDRSLKTVTLADGFVVTLARDVDLF